MYRSFRHQHADNATHRRITELGASAEKLIAQYEVNPTTHFAATRRHIRDFLLSTPVGSELEEIVFELLA